MDATRKTCRTLVYTAPRDFISDMKLLKSSSAAAAGRFLDGLLFCGGGGGGAAGTLVDCLARGCAAACLARCFANKRAALAVLNGLCLRATFKEVGTNARSAGLTAFTGTGRGCLAPLAAGVARACGGGGTKFDPPGRLGGGGGGAPCPGFLGGGGGGAPCPGLLGGGGGGTLVVLWEEDIP